MNINKRYLIATIIVGILLAGCATTRIDPLQPIELGNLTFLPPPGEDWEYDRNDSSDIEFVLFKRGKGAKAPAFGVMVWQWRADDPVKSEDDIWEKLLEPYRDVFEAEAGNEIRKTLCNPNQTLTAMGLLCQVEGEGYIDGSFWATGMVGDSRTMQAEGHIYAFVFPDDKRKIGVIEYFQQLVPGVDPVDTQKLLDEFARNVTLMN